jgi:5'-nucleotidase
MPVNLSKPAVFLRLSALTAFTALVAGCQFQVATNQPNDAAHPPPVLAYATHPAVYTKGSAIVPNAPAGGEAFTSYSVSPELPAGLTLDPSSGVISGTPSAMAAPLDYAVTASGWGGSATGTLTIAVDARLDVLFTTDEHSHLFGFAPELDDFPAPATPGSGAVRGGVLRRAAVLARERAAAQATGASVVTVSAGDFSQGTLAAMALLGIASDLKVMSALGYDAVALGNHEFDTSPAGLARAIHVAGSNVPPLVLTNVLFSGTSAADDALEALYGPEESQKPIAPFRVVTKDGVRIGVVAVMGPAAARDAGPFAAPVTFSTASPQDHEASLAAIVAAVTPVVSALRADHAADVVIVLGHGGIGAPGSAIRGDDERLAAAIPGIDLLVSGHTHRSPGAPVYVTDPDGRQVPVLQVAPFGEGVGRAALIVKANARPEFESARSDFIPVDDRIVATDADFPSVADRIDEVLGALETEQGAAPAPLEAALTLIEGAPVVHDPAHPGDLYFRPLGHTSFDVPGLRAGETNVANLDTDAMLDVAVALAGTTDVALQSRGAIRADLRQGATGVLSFADVFATVALGVDPTDGSPGYPLDRFFISTAELRAALEQSLQAATQDPDYLLLPGGLRVEFDPTRPLFDAAHPAGPGWITRLALVDGGGAETSLYDASATATAGWTSDPYALHSIVTTFQVAAFAASFGVTLRDASGVPTTAVGAILRRPGGSAVKDYQSLAAFVRSLGELPSRYDERTVAGHVPRRVVCAGAACGAAGL